ncbi:MAG: glycosyltransferase family 2 protein [Synechococcales bacterium]|nr:glycosyltransferase family 2 protein [Synechococcales bacterium]
MSENSWHENDSYEALELADTLTLSVEEEDIAEPSPLDEGFERRRLKAAVILASIWLAVIFLHTVDWGSWVILGLTGGMAAQMLRAFLGKPMLHSPVSLASLVAEPTGQAVWQESSPQVAPSELLATTIATTPAVTLMVSAKNEEAVIEKLVRNLCGLDYPADCYEVWIIDDASTDRTPKILQQLQQEFPQLNVFQRAVGATGGKSGALNQVLPQTQGEFLVVFDADAQIQPDFLQQALPIFLTQERVGALQLRKAIAQSEIPGSPEAGNFWVEGQRSEMLLDAFMQQQRIAVGGIGELRGNGQIVRRQALMDCGGWNEETITDDLDMTFRLHLSGWDIHCFSLPPVYEEGVTTAIALWHQRNRWAEGGYQRYLDYWRLIAKNRMGTKKTVDLLVFWLMQYAMPTAAVPDFVIAIARHRPLLLTPISILTFFFFVFSTLRGIRRKQLASGQGFENFWQAWGLPLFQALQGFVYMMHWFVVVGSVTARMAFLPKRLKWVKTMHKGS